MPQRAVRIGEAERGQPPPGRLGGEPQLLARHPADRVEQRPVEQLLVQPAHLAAVQRALGGKDGDHVAAAVRPVAERASQPAQAVRVVRHQMGAAQPVQLQAVLDGAQEAVRRGERGSVVAADVTAGGEGRQRVQRGPAAQRVVGPAVHELQQLYGELHVPQPARSELELALGHGRRQRVLDPAVARECPHRTGRARGRRRPDAP